MRNTHAAKHCLMWADKNKSGNLRVILAKYPQAHVMFSGSGTYT